MNFGRLPLKKVLKVCFIIDNKNLILFNYIFELDQEDRRKQEVETTQAMKYEDFDDSFESEDPTEISGKCKSVNTYEKKNLKKTANQMSNCTNLLSIIVSTMAKYKEKNSEFSSLRNAKFSTMALLYELHISTTQRFTYNYNRCQQQCDIYYYCTVCEDFDLCEKSCNIELKHEDTIECSVSSIVDMKQSYEQNSLNSTDLKSEIEKQQATCLQADRRYMEAMTMSQEKNIMQV
ncbi:unnamed protein product [Rotaria sp. Silwood2]|nr:unnamed protein product [Rotaria sp. Silwood2]CAF4747468.1 unnamed protein product [Rotaria sp. Silwood2]